MNSVKVLGKIEKRKKLNRKLSLLANAIRRKYMMLKLGTAASEEVTRKLLKPVSEPLEKIVSTINESSSASQPTTTTTHHQTVIIKKEPRISAIKKHTRPAKPRAKIPHPPTHSFPDDPSRSDDDDYYDYEPFEYSPHEEEEVKEEKGGDEVFSAVSDPMQELPSRTEKSVRVKTEEEHLQQYPPLARVYLRLMMDSTKKDLFDRTFGPKPDRVTHNWSIGNKPISFKANNSIMVGDEEFSGTEGLYELLFMNRPAEFKITKADRKNYRKILNLSNVHRAYYTETGKIRGSGSHKYTQFVKPLVQKDSSSSSSSKTPSKTGTSRHPSSVTPSKSKKSPKGKGLLLLDEYKVNTDKPVEYVYWNDVNELCDRLRLLYASKRAGNNAHDNEIASILEELKEEGIIM